MKVLFVCHRAPFPPKRGGKIRPFNIIRHLTGQGHEVTVASLARNAAEAEEAQGLRAHCEDTLIELIPDHLAWARTLARLPTLTPSSFGYFHSPTFARRVRRELTAKAYDLVFVHCSSVAPYVANVPSSAIRILDFGDMDSQKWREYVSYRPLPLAAGYWLEAVKLERAERRLARSFDLCTCTTRAELDSLHALGVTESTGWFPNGVDSQFFSPAADYDPNLIAFVGRMDYFPNQQAVTDFCGTVLPRLRAHRPDLRFAIVGADPPGHILDLGDLPGVTVTGSVPDVRAHVTRAALTVAPLTIARGTQNKILESMAMGVPVVCSVTASRGVDAAAGEHLLTADTPAEYERQIGAILDSADLRARLARSARERVLSHHSWQGSMVRLDELISATIARCAAASGRRASAAA